MEIIQLVIMDCVYMLISFLESATMQKLYILLQFANVHTSIYCAFSLTLKFYASSCIYALTLMHVVSCLVLCNSTH